MSDQRDGQSQSAAAAITVVLWLLLIDVAVETFLSGAPARWWVVGVAAAFLGSSAGVMWRVPASRGAWSTHATASFFVLLALLAGTAWLPDGLANGVVMFRQPTSVVFSAVSALATALAGLMLSRIKALPLWGRVALGLLAVYGVAAFAIGAAEGTSYSHLFQGGSLWRRLPYWLQGAFIGALVAVPLAAIAALVDALKRSRAADGRGWGLQQSVALGLSVLMAVPGFTMSGGIGSGPGRAVRQPSVTDIANPLDDTYRDLSRTLSGPDEGQPRSPEEVAQRLEQQVGALDAAAGEIPRDTFDMAAVVQKVGRDPVKLFEWVRDETYLVPYRGLLRGPTGVLMDRLGNSLDRAMLLYEMLRSTGQTVRLARSVLTEEQATTLLEKARTIPLEGVPAPTRFSEPAKSVFGAQRQVPDSGALQEALDNLTAEQSNTKEAVQSRAAKQAAALAAAIGQPARNEKEDDARRIRLLRDHWWVEWSTGSGWTALDPSLPDAAPGGTFARAEATLQPASSRALGTDLLHRIELRVTVETWNDGAVKEVPVLTRDLLPAELTGKRIALRFVPMSWPRAALHFEETQPSKLSDLVLAQKEWLPLLQIDGENVAMHSFDEHGELKDTTAPYGGAFGGLGSSIGGLLGGSRDRREPAQPVSKGQVTAVWIDYELHVPGQPARAARREIFDLLGPAARSEKTIRGPNITEAWRLERGMALLGETEILVMGSRLSPEFVDAAIAEHWLANKDGLVSALRTDQDRNGQSRKSDADGMTAFPALLYGLALARGEWSRFAGGVYQDAPNVLSSHSELRQGAQGELLTSQGFDIVYNAVSIRRGVAQDPFLLRLEQGVVDTNAEAVLTARLAGGQQLPGIFGASAWPGIDWIVVRSTGDPVWRQIGLSGDIRARIERDVSSGYVVVVPSKPLLVGTRAVAGWWRVDPNTGETLGMGDRGWGQTAAEIDLKVSALTIGVVGLTLHEFVCMYSNRGSIRGTSVCGAKYVCTLGALLLAIRFFRSAAALAASCRFIN